MSYVLVQFKVKDFTAWKDKFDVGHGLRKSYGEHSHQIFREFDDHSKVTILYEWDTLENATAYFSNEQLRKTMKEAGVENPPDITFLDEMEMVRRHIVRKDY